MKALYCENTANFPRLKTDKHFIDYGNEYKFSEITDKTARFIEEFQLLDEKLWKTFTRQYEIRPDGVDGGWRGEYWGKMMRGACFIYTYTKNQKLLDTLKNTVKNIIETQDEWGRISTYPVNNEFTGWDMWSRKYVLLGMQYFLEINDDKDLEKEIILSQCRQVDYIMSKIGPRNEKKIPITRTAKHWYGLNSSSVLEPVVRLYSITGEEKYLNFAKYIADEGGTYAENIFRLAEKKQLKLHQYPVTKAYEMTSCFEGLLELYRITGEEWLKTAIINYADLILENELSVIGCAGCTHELFDNSLVRQANTNNHRVMQETCVTVTLMKFFMQLNLLTGDSRYIDAFETAYYNAYLGSVNTNKNNASKIYEVLPENFVQKPLPFDSYSPLTRGHRGKGIGGFRLMENNEYYGCCVCIGSAGVGAVHKTALMSYEKGVVLNLYINGSYTTEIDGKKAKINVKTNYPADNVVNIEVESEKAFALKLRIPAFSKKTLILKNGKEFEADNGYTEIDIKEGKESIALTLDMPTKIIKPIPYGSQVIMNKVVWGENSVVIPTFDEEDPLAKRHIALSRGPLMLAQDSRFGYDLSVPINIKDSDGFAVTKKAEADFDTLLCATVEKEDGEEIKLCDYSSAGKTWNSDSEMAVWMINN